MSKIKMLLKAADISELEIAEDIAKYVSEKILDDLEFSFDASDYFNETDLFVNKLSDSNYSKLESDYHEDVVEYLSDLFTEKKQEISALCDIKHDLNAKLTYRFESEAEQSISDYFTDLDERDPQRLFEIVFYAREYGDVLKEENPYVFKDMEYSLQHDYLEQYKDRVLESFLEEDGDVLEQYLGSEEVLRLIEEDVDMISYASQIDDDVLESYFEEIYKNEDQFGEHIEEITLDFLNNNAEFSGNRLSDMLNIHTSDFAAKWKENDPIAYGEDERALIDNIIGDIPDGDTQYIVSQNYHYAQMSYDDVKQSFDEGTKNEGKGKKLKV